MFLHNWDRTIIILQDCLNFYGDVPNVILKACITGRFNYIATTALQDSCFSTSQTTMHKKWSFPLRISSVIVTKSEVFCGFGQIYWRNPSFMQCCGIWKIEKKFLCLYWKKPYEFLSVTKTVLKDILVEKEVPDVIENVVALKYVFKVMF